MKTESRVFEILTIFFFGVAIIYVLVSHEPAGTAGGILIRAVEPLEGIDIIFGFDLFPGNYVTGIRVVLGDSTF